jgi:hypothetical protein
VASIRLTEAVLPEEQARALPTLYFQGPRRFWKDVHGEPMAGVWRAANDVPKPTSLGALSQRKPEKQAWFRQAREQPRAVLLVAVPGEAWKLRPED